MREQAERELRKTAEELQIRNEELNAFARTVAHDLKSPVAQMIGFAELLREASPDMLANKKDEWINNIVRIGEKSAETIQALLDLARYENEEAQFHSFDMWFTFEAVVFKLHNNKSENKQSIKFPREWPQVVGNPNWMSEVWYSLIGNAIQSGGEPLKVEVSWQQWLDNKVKFSIENNGRKLSFAEQEAFFQLSGATTLKRDISLNLGISIAKKLIEKQGGEIGVESTNNIGSTVWFTLPAAIPS
ncbi:MAG: HAMP domain-containing sensor histidine kinase [Bacteroidota bacterium]